MRSRFAVLACATLAGAAASPVAAQTWVGPQPPCDIEAGHFRINSAIVNLKSATERPNTRERMLRQTEDVLRRTITGDGQGDNPAAWYYFGRYYVEMKDAAGADSAFRKALALAPQCRQDIDGYRERLWTDVLTAGLRTWQEGKLDSATVLLRQAGALRPGHPRPFRSLGQLYETQNQLDSAARYMTQAAAAAGSDTAFADDRKEALGTVARLYIRRLQRDSAAQRWERTRFSRDSIQRLLTADSTVLSRIEASSASRRARGARLRPADQRSFSRDSTARAQGITERRATLAARAATVRAESSAAQPAYDPAIAAYRAYLEAYPEATDAVPGLASLFYQSGRVADAEAGFAAIYPRDEPVDPDVALDAGRGALRANLFAVAAQLLTRGLEGRPFNRDGLVDLATSYLALRDSVRLLAAAQRLAAVDPLNRTTLRLLAAGWDLRDKGDSARKYQDLAGGGLQVEIAIATFLADSAGFRLTGVAGNGGSTPSRAQRVTFEFLDAQGTAQVTQAIDIPSIPPRGTHRIEIRVPGQGLVAWRYRPS